MKRRIALLSIATVVALAVNVLWFSSVFDIREIRVFGTHFLTRTQVLEQAGVVMGEPLARVDATAVERRVLQLPEVASVDVRRGFPHAVVIEVHERVAIAAAASDDGSWWLVDRTGRLFRHVAKKPKGLTEVRGFTEQLRGMGARTAASFPRWLQLRVARVTVFAPSDIRLSMKNGKLVMWGGEEREARKAEVLYALLQVHARTYDVSAPDAPATHA